MAESNLFRVLVERLLCLPADIREDLPIGSNRPIAGVGERHFAAFDSLLILYAFVPPVSSPIDLTDLKRPSRVFMAN
jgi:hypothetical protein